jgi:CheY-like chemotaxis protein/AraC-like DNA-binding protein
MPKVLIVEDEPAAGRYLRSMIELKRPDFTVVGIAENGRIALEQVSRLEPDLVITDVRMPVMDGIELVAALKEGFPSLPAIIVSGYQEFEYARRALDTGVVDYLLKPVNQAKLEEVLDRIGSSLSTRDEARRASALLRLVNGDPFERGCPIAPDELFWLAVARIGGLPSRFKPGQAGEETAFGEGGFFILPGCDSREWIYLGQEGSLDREAFASLVREAAESSRGPFRTVLMASEAIRGDGLREAACAACIDVDKLIVAGSSRVHSLAPKQEPEAIWDQALADRIAFALKESRLDLLERAVRDMAASWQASQKSLLAAESQLRRILHFVIREAPRADASAAADLEFLLEEAFAGIRDFQDLSDAAWFLVARVSGAGSIEVRDHDVPAFFDCILRYVGSRYSEPLNLASLSETFRISPSYLSKLFRQHAGRSFGEYLSSIRIDAAMRLIRENPDMPLKNVAEKAGFNDPFYFSRVFKSIAGLPPSDYARLGPGGPPIGPE